MYYIITYFQKTLLMLLIIRTVMSFPDLQLIRPKENDYIEDYGKNLLPYNFMFNHYDGLGTRQHREEKKDEDGVVRGSYGYTDAFGNYRHVNYIADEKGFHAVVRTNEPGVENRNSADVAVVVKSPPVRVKPVVQRNIAAISET